MCSTARPNTLVVDFSVIPSRPDPSAAEEFIFKKVKLDLKDVKVIQFHNIDRRFYIEMVDSQKPLAYQHANNLKHGFLCAENKKEYRIPVYYLDGASTVRLHDLPPSIPHAAVIQHMRQYGIVANCALERWKKYFGGMHNGVRVLRMYLSKSIPSYLTIEKFETFCTHSPFGDNNEPQVKTCRICSEPQHVNTKCAQTKKTNPSTLVSTPPPASPLPADDFPPLVQKNTHSESDTRSPQDQNKQQQQQIQTPPVKNNESRPLSEYSLDQQAIYDEYVQTNAFPHISDPARRKESLWYFAGRDMELNQAKLKEQQQQ